jgi:hypothetical protein
MRNEKGKIKVGNKNETVGTINTATINTARELVQIFFSTHDFDPIKQLLFPSHFPPRRPPDWADLVSPSTR